MVNDCDARRQTLSGECLAPSRGTRCGREGGQYLSAPSVVRKDNEASGIYIDVLSRVQMRLRAFLSTYVSTLR